MRLIDADLLKKYMLNNGKEVERFLQYIDEQPTVYNADKVIKKLEEKIEFAGKMLVEKPADKLDEIANNTAEDFIAAYDEAIDCVKGGLIPGENARENQWISVREKLPECGVPVAVLLQGQYPEDVEYEVARLTDLSDTEHPGKYWYKRGCGYLQHPKYMDGVGNLAGYEVVAWLPLPMKHEREVE